MIEEYLDRSDFFVTKNSESLSLFSGDILGILSFEMSPTSFRLRQSHILFLIIFLVLLQ